MTPHLHCTILELSTQNDALSKGITTVKINTQLVKTHPKIWMLALILITMILLSPLLRGAPTQAQSEPSISFYGLSDGAYRFTAGQEAVISIHIAAGPNALATSVSCEFTPALGTVNELRSRNAFDSIMSGMDAVTTVKWQQFNAGIGLYDRPLDMRLYIFTPSTPTQGTIFCETHYQSDQDGIDHRMQTPITTVRIAAPPTP
jgi:hypothetical protein